MENPGGSETAKAPFLGVLTGLQAMALGALFFSLMTVFVKLLGPAFPTQEVVFLRSLISLILTAVALYQRGIQPLGSHRKLLLLRGLSGFLALSCFFYALTELPLAIATVVQFTNPIFTALLAAFLLGESWDRGLFWTALLGLSGVFLIARPWQGGADQLNLVALELALTGAILTSIAYVTVRRLAPLEKPLVTILYFPLVATPISGLASLPVWLWPTVREWGYLLAVGVMAQLGQIFLTQGLYRERAGRATTVGYLQLAFAAVWGILFFGEVPSWAGLAGSALIVLSILRLNTRVEKS